ncbi:hypothetical protein DMC30DRAFT_32334 [Rhodotorula diobovata]|uniref:DNA polymerase n=1 Tax=Rhodotorula diobovata TaxID=5288 RepID=A0A5C5G4S4_9BASI|nr:hypothetical protein DMC30DRAFT_32334 [Rhodotorula diobovata]
MLAGQAGRQIPGRMRICRLSAREKYARFCERSGPLTRRLEAHGVEWWESPRSAALYSTFPPLIEERGEHPGSTEAATTATTAATTRGDNERVLASQPSAPLRKPSRDTSRPTGFFVRPASGASILSRPPAGYNPFRFPSGASSAFSSVADRRAAELRSKIPADAEIDLKQIMADLRDLELLDLLRGVKPKSAVGYKDATRALYPLFHKFDVGESKRVTFADLEATLAPDFTIPWTSIAERLLEGRVSRLRGLTAKEKAALLFLQIYNIGPARAVKYADAGCRTLADLEKRQDSDKLKMTRAQKIGLRHREDIQRLIPRAEVEKLQVALEKALAAVDSRFECEVLGSYRRGVEFSSDIDLAVRHPEFQDKDDEETSKALMGAIVDELEKQKLVSKDDQLMLGGKKYAGLIRLPRHESFRRIDIRLAPYHSYPYMLLGSSGDAMLMKLLRHTAKQKGMCLNEYGMGDKYSSEDQNPNGFKPGTLKLVKSEREIFDLLGMPYLEPKERELKVWRNKYAKAGVAAVEYLHRL